MKRWWILFAVVVVAIGWFIWQGRALEPSINVVGGQQRYLDPIFPQVDSTKNIVYGDNQNLKLDLYQPQGDTLAQRPVVVNIHGGGFIAGSKEGMAAASEQFAKRGYVALAINYRLTGAGQGFSISDPQLPKAVRDAQHDALAAVRWARKNAVQYRLDPNLVFAGGYSAGAMTSLYLDFNHSDVGNSGNPGFSSQVKAVYSMAGAVLPADFNLITSDDFPAIMLHGEADTVVPYAVAVQTYNKIKAAGIISEFHSYPGVGHGVAGEPDAAKRVYAFFYRFISQNLPVESPSPQPSVSPQPSASPVASASPNPSPSVSPSPSPSVSPSPLASPEPSGGGGSPSPQPSASPALGGNQPDTGTPTTLTVMALLLVLAALTAKLLTRSHLIRN